MSCTTLESISTNILQGLVLRVTAASHREWTQSAPLAADVQAVTGKNVESA